MGLLLGAVSLATTGYLAYKDANKKNIIRRKEKNEFKNKFQQFMKAINKENKIDQTYEVLDYIPKNYGNDAIIGIPIGYDVGDLIKLISSLEITYRATIIIETSSTKNSAYMRVHYVKNDISFEDEIKFKWYKCINSIDKTRNNVYETFSINSIKEDKSYGYALTVDIPDGLKYNTILNSTDIIEQSLGYKLYGKYDSNSNKLIYRLITNPMDEKYPFKPYKTNNPYELFIGYAYDYTPIIADMRYLVHGAVSGRTGTGKSVELQIILANHIHWFSPRTFHLYLAQLSSKSDVNVFKDVEQCKYCANNIEEVYKLLTHLKSEMDKRNRLFEKCAEEKNKVVLNIYKYNSLNNRNILPEIIFYSDEFMCYQVSSNDDEDTKELKKKCLAILMSIFTEGRNVGIHVLYALQRPDCASLDPLMKAQTGLRVCFKQENEASAKTVLDGVESPIKLCNLQKREAFVICEDTYLMKTLYLPEDDILKFIKHRIDKTHKNYISFEEENIEILEEQSNNNQNNSNNKKQRDRHKEYLQKKKQLQEQQKKEIENKKLPTCAIRK